MGLNTKFGKTETDVQGALDVTFTSNPPTPSDTQTVADGDAPTAAENGQFMANVEATFAGLVADIADLRRVIDLGE